jgi:hypothetical protein
MRCPECDKTFEILQSRIFDFTTTTLGCPRSGRWPEYTAKVYIDNVELVKCGCGVAPNVPCLDELESLLFGKDLKADDIALDPKSKLVYVGTWSDDKESWSLSQHQEQ